LAADGSCSTRLRPKENASRWAGREELLNAALERF
jgi:hypothetical protein